MVCRLLGWDAPAFGGRICVDAILLGELAAGEFVLFVFNLPSGLVLPILPFFCWRCMASRGGALPPVLSFKDVHQPRGGGEQAGLRLRLPRELVTRLFLQHSEERMITILVKVGGELRLRGAGQTASVVCRRASNSLAWMVLL
jgi:hypothetical protein